MTAEDPVEFQLPGINQVQMKEQIGLNFAVALRSFLRQDPNIIMVGEIRDFETAEIAIKAALTGHLVLSTLHTNDAPSTISRLMNMGIEPFLVATSVHLICAQRLIRRICQECKVEEESSPQVLADAGFTPDGSRVSQGLRGDGVPGCNNKGYKGRVGTIRSSGGHRRTARADSGGSFGAGTQEEGDRAGNDYLAAQRADQSDGRGSYHAGRSDAGDHAVDRGRVYCRSETRELAREAEDRCRYRRSVNCSTAWRIPEDPICTSRPIRLRASGFTEN